MSSNSYKRKMTGDSHCSCERIVISCTFTAGGLSSLLFGIEWSTRYRSKKAPDMLNILHICQQNPKEACLASKAFCTASFTMKYTQLWSYFQRIFFSIPMRSEETLYFPYSLV